MTDRAKASDGDQVRTLQELIRTRIDEHGWSLGQLASLSGDRLSKARWGQLAAGRRMRSWPDVETMEVISETLGYDITTVVLASAAALGLDVRRTGPLLAQLLPSGTDALSEEMLSAVLAMVRAAVAEAARRGDDADRADSVRSLEWDDRDARPATRPRDQRRAEGER